MPSYEYRCTQCNHLFEVVHGVGGSAGPCPVCGGPARRVFTSVGLIFKGKGFHTTDYRKAPPREAAPKESSKESSPDTAGKTETSSTVPTSKSD